MRSINKINFARKEMNQKCKIYRDLWYCHSLCWQWLLRTMADWLLNRCNPINSDLNFQMLKNYCAMIRSLNFGLSFSTGNWWRPRSMSCYLHTNWVVELMAAPIAEWHPPFRHDPYRNLRLCLSCTAEWFASDATFEMWSARYHQLVHNHRMVIDRDDCLSIL